MFRLRYDFRGSLYNICSLNRSLTCTRCLATTHYETLNIERSSTPNEIRAAYIKLCKENHPDKNKADESLHKKFLRINEAYNVLSKPVTKKKYDDSIAYLDESKRIRSALYKNDLDVHDFRSAFNDPFFYHNRKDLDKDQIDDDNYYGIKGVKKMSNNTLLLILIGVVICSGFCQVITIKSSLMSREIDRTTKENAIILDNIRKLTATRTKEETIAEIERSYHNNLNKLSSQHDE